jgi:hypothetical protein
LGAVSPHGVAIMPPVRLRLQPTDHTPARVLANDEAGEFLRAWASSSRAANSYRAGLVRIVSRSPAARPHCRGECRRPRAGRSRAGRHSIRTPSARTRAVAAARCSHRNTTAKLKYNRETDVLNGLNGSLLGRSTDENSASSPPRFRVLVRRLPHCVPYPYQSDQSARFLCFGLQDMPEKWAFMSPDVRFAPTASVAPRMDLY